ncbi:DUF3288 family protein [Geminocystis sp. NIES-3709]|uniref:DUF3288 family protein n=1 Tax=Geminocystis sp. NIES-3709 TaxID=1617448 RepID=UPI0005FC5D3B|nr:DUF3288 family protein [Geminocystis sp. NIES-3709]BAQ64148.1 hypothetical protein GM3709_913 [Geminocystis sp. NIES-3709]
MSTDQKHPLGHIDREIIKKVFVEGKTDYNLAEVARLKIRYQNFPGARDIQHDLETIIKEWDITEDELFSQARLLHTSGAVYRKSQEVQEDWS